MKRWLCSISLEDNDVIRSLNTGITQNIVSMSRKYIAYLILSCSADDRSFESANNLSDEFKLPNNHTDFVWDLFIKSGILRNTNGRYSAKAWMTENGLIEKVDADKPIEVTKQVEMTKVEMPKEILDLVSTSDAEIDMPSPEVLRRYQESKFEAKEYVRPNVRLSRNDILYLKQSLSDAQIARILDRLSDWKREKGIAAKPGNFDFDQINKWVIKWLYIEESKEKREMRFTQRPPFKSFDTNATSNSNQPEGTPTEEFPSWLMGN